MNADVVGRSNHEQITYLFESAYHAKIRRHLTDCSFTEMVGGALFNINLTAFIAIALSANGLSIQGVTDYLVVSYIFVAIAFALQLGISKNVDKASSNKVIFLFAGVALLEGATLILALYFNAHATQQAPPLVAVVCVCATSFLTLASTIRMYSSFFVGTLAVFVGCFYYLFSLGSDNSSHVIFVLPLIITFVFILTLGYLLYLRQIRLLHHQYHQEALNNIIQDKNRLLSKAISAEQASHRELTRAHALRDKIIRHIGHDLRQPINALNYSLFNIEKSELNRSQLESIDIATQSVEAANYLIEQVLQISTYKKTELKAHLQKFDLGQLLSAIEREYSGVARQAGCELRVVESCLSLYSDEQMVARILKNYLSNALRYAKGAKILLGVRRRRHFVEIQVVDNGPGIPLDIQDKLFEEFVIGHNAVEQEGFGLGLSIAKHLASLCEGDVSIASTEGKGTCCSLVLPREFPK